MVLRISRPVLGASTKLGRFSHEAFARRQGARNAQRLSVKNAEAALRDDGITPSYAAAPADIG